MYLKYKFSTKEIPITYFCLTMRVADNLLIFFQYVKNRWWRVHALMLVIQHVWRDHWIIVRNLILVNVDVNVLMARYDLHFGVVLLVM